MRVRQISVTVVLAVLSLLGPFLEAAPPNQKLRRAGTNRVPNQYIVVLADSVLPAAVPETARQIASAHGARVEMTWSHAVKGFHAVMPEAAAERLSRHPLVKYVEENASWFSSTTTQTNVDQKTCDPSTQNCSTVADDRLWHLDRIDQSSPTVSNQFRSCDDGDTVDVYVVDGGVNKNHQEFAAGTVLSGYNASGDGMPADDPCMGFALPAGVGFEESRLANELGSSGHGTAVASLIAGQRVGVAKAAKIIPVKVIRCDNFSARRRVAGGTYLQNETMVLPSTGARLYRATTGGTTNEYLSVDPANWPLYDDTPNTKQDDGVLWEAVAPDVWQNAQTSAMLLSGLEWIAQHHTTNPAVVNISQGYSIHDDDYDDSAVESAISTLLAENITVVVSANNQNSDACDTSPARMSTGTSVITVGGTMLVNRPWDLDTNELPSGKDPAGTGTHGTEPAFDPMKPVVDARWLCGPGDSSIACSNSSAPTETRPATHNAFHGFHAGSNTGQCVTIFAPAKNVPVAAVGASDDYRDPRIKGGHASGTSWAAPIVAGAAAHVLQRNTAYTPAQVRAALLANSIDGAIDVSSLTTYKATSTNWCTTSPTTCTEVTGTPNKLLRLGDVRLTGVKAVPSSSALNLSATSAGSGVSLQWFSVDPGFEATATRGAHYSSISSMSASTPASASSVAAGRYWVRATGTCGAADSDILTVPPQWLCQTALAATAPAAAFTHAAQTNQTIAVTSSTSSCNWAARTYDGWIHITGGTSGTGAGTVTYSLDANAGETARTGTIIVGLSTYTVTQNPQSVKGDFNNDRKADLVWQNGATQATSVWLMNGATYVSESTLPTKSSDWVIVAADDFNNDGHSDLVWRNTSTYATVVTFLNGTTYVSESSLPTVSSAAWRIAGTGDFNGDGKPDLVWQNSTSYQTVVWLLNGTTYVSEATLPNVSSSAWSIRGVGDFTGDGKPDLVWRNSSTYATVLWVMDGTTYQSESTLPTVSSSAWEIYAVGDYTGDRKGDLVWRNSSTFAASIWRMNGTSYVDEASLTAVSSSNWQIVAPR